MHIFLKNLFCGVKNLGDFFKKSALLRKSTGELLEFYISKDHNIICKYFTDEGSLVNTVDDIHRYVLEFAVDIDKYDKIHLLCLTNEGKLEYCVCIQDQWTNHMLTKLDTRSNKFSHLQLKLVKDNIHIFYSTSNLLNPRVWTIHHILGSKTKWDKQAVISLTPGKHMSPFYVDFDSMGNTYLVYKDILKGKQHIYYTSFNTFLNKWNKSPKQMSEYDTDNLHPYLFVDNNDNVHLVWSALVDSSLKLVYQRLSSIGNNRKWRYYPLPQTYGNSTHSLLLQENGFIKLLYKENNLLKALISNDLGVNWTVETSVEDMAFDSLLRLKYSSNYSIENHRYKINETYGILEDRITLPYLDIIKPSEPLDNFVKNFNKKLQRENIESDDVSEQRVSSSANETSYSPKIHKDMNIEELEDTSVNLSKNQSPIDSQSEDNLSDNHIIERQDALSSLVDENIKEFIEKILIDIDRISSQIKDINEAKIKVEKMLLSNIKNLENNILSEEHYAGEIKESLDFLEKALGQCSLINKEIYNITDAIKDSSQSNLKYIKEIEGKIIELKEALSSLENRGLFKRLLGIFK